MIQGWRTKPWFIAIHVYISRSNNNDGCNNSCSSIEFDLVGFLLSLMLSNDTNPSSMHLVALKPCYSEKKINIKNWHDMSKRFIAFDIVNCRAPKETYIHAHTDLCCSWLQSLWGDIYNLKFILNPCKSFYYAENFVRNFDTRLDTYTMSQPCVMCQKLIVG